MIYPKSPCVVETEGNAQSVQETAAGTKCEKEMLLSQIGQLKFAMIDLNLFLDTHPEDQEALTLFKNLASTYQSLVYDYEAAYGALTACGVSDKAPFDWVSPNEKWPWQK